MEFQPRTLLQFKIAFILLMLFGLASLPFTANLHLSNDFRVYFSASNPQLKAFDHFENEFASHDSLTLVLHRADQSWLSQDSLAIIDRITEQLWQLPYSDRVNSLTNYQYTYAEADTLFVQRLTDYSTNSEQLRQALNSDSQLKENFLSTDESVTLIQVALMLPKDDDEATKKLVELSSHWLTQWRQRHPEITFYQIGSVISNVTLEQAVQSDLQRLVPMSYLVITLGLLLFLRSVIATILTLTITSLSIVFTFSIFAFFKTELTPVAGFVPSVVLTLAVADCVHYLSSYRYLITQQGMTFAQANYEAFKINRMPIAITSFTTAVGVLFLNFSDSPPYRDLGNMVAIGVTLAWVFTITLLPLALSKWPIKFSPQIQSKTDRMVKYSNWLLNHQKLASFLVILLVLVGITGLFRLNISENWSKYFSQKFELAQAIELLKTKFSRLHRYELVLATNSNKSVNDVDYLTHLDQLLAFLQRHPDVRHTQSYGQLLKRLNQNMHNDQLSFYRMPETRELAAQYTLLYELSAEQGLGIDQFLNQQRTASRISIVLQPMNSSQLIAFENQTLDFVNHQLNMDPDNPDYRLELSSMDHIFAHIAERNIISMILGSGIALLIISVLLAILLKSIKYGLISIIPNLFPGLIAYGIWGYLDGYLDLALSVVICMSIGIIVDDSVHFLTKYLRARRVHAYNPDQSLKYAFQIVGRALITTTVILVGGFATITASPMTPTANTGLLLCITLVIALIVDFLLLPLILKWSDKT